MAKYNKILEPWETNFDADEQWVIPLPFYDGWRIAGNAQNNNLAGSSGWIISNDIIYGYDGNDKLDGKYGNDRLYGGNDNDRLYGRDGNDRLYGEDGNDSLYGGNGIDHLYGGDDDGNDYLNGGDNIDHLFGGDGDDSLNGGSGNDVMQGGLGDDYYTVDNFSDVVIENSNAGTDLVITSIDYTLGANVENLRLDGNAYRGTGNSLNNDIRGTNNSNILDGGSGRDRLRGRGGNDTYYVDNIQDVVVEASGEGSDLVKSSVDFTLPTNVEKLTLIDNARVGQGNNLDNDIWGNNHNNTLEGQGGQDELIGATSFYSSDERDILTGGSGGDGFYLGNSFASYYQSSLLNNSTPLDNFQDIRGELQYARITDFEDGVDRIYLEGSSLDYELAATTVGGGGIGIYLDRNNSNSIDIEDDLIAVVQGDNDNLNLSNGSQFLFI